jgi:hypothetical protein
MESINMENSTRVPGSHPLVELEDLLLEMKEYQASLDVYLKEVEPIEANPGQKTRT